MRPDPVTVHRPDAAEVRRMGLRTSLARVRRRSGWWSVLLAALLALVPAVTPANAVALGSFTPTGTMREGHRHHTATLLLDGTVLITGSAGFGYGDLIPEVYDPSTGTFTQVGRMTVPRAWHTATLLPDGRVLIAGGQAGADATDTAELYDPTTRTFSRPLGPTGEVESMLAHRSHHTATLLPDGKVLLAGGYGSYGAAISIVDVFDPETNTFDRYGNLTERRADHAAALLPDGRVLVTGGRGSATGPLSSAEVFDPATRTFSLTVAQDGSPAPMSSGRYRHSATLLNNGQVLVAGGSHLTSADLYDPITGTFRATSSQWGTDTRVRHTATLLASGAVLIAGGHAASDEGTVSASALLYDPGTDTWTATGSMGSPRMAHTATLLHDDSVLVAGGYGMAEQSAELYVSDSTPEPSSTLVGFLAPVEMDGAWNTVKGGSTVPLKFQVFTDDTEVTDVAAVDSLTVTPVACPDTDADANLVQETTADDTPLRYADGHFIQAWRTPRTSGCYAVTVTAGGSSITANFRLR